MLNWPIKWNNKILLNTDHDGFDRYFTEILFSQKSGEDSRGVANVWDHPCLTSITLNNHPPPKT